MDLRKAHNQEPLEVAKSQVSKILNTYDKSDRTVVEAAAKAFISSSKKGRR